MKSNPDKEAFMKVSIDYDLCMGDRNCNKVCPEVFEYDEDQKVYIFVSSTECKTEAEAIREYEDRHNDEEE